MKQVLLNPNYVYIFSFLIPFLVYSLGWSTLYPDLSWQLFLFYILTFSSCFVIGKYISKVKPFAYTTIKTSKHNYFIILLIYFLYFIEIVYSKNIPLFGLLNGTFDYSEDTFGIPIVHTFLVTFNTFYCIYIFHQYISYKKLKILFYYFLTIFPFIILVYRSSILSVLLSSFFVFLISRNRISINMILKSLIGVVFVLFLFGYMGNVRSGKGDPTYIPRSSGATEEFLSSYVPKEFYWSYLYIASPVANLQNNINFTPLPRGNFHQLFINECLPNFIVKFLPFLQVSDIDFYQINPFLNVGTAFIYSFSYLRWEGITFFFFYFILVINFYYLIIIKSFTFKVTGLAILFNVIIFATFHNTISYSASSLQLLYPCLFSLFHRFFFKPKIAVNV